MATGVPVVSTDVTGIPEILQDGETGLSIPQCDPGALSDACLKLLQDAPLRCRLAERARKLVEERFDIRGNSVQLRGVFERILARRASPSVLKVRGEAL